ncbi:MAG: DUF503 domain-containing protein [Proteobacteria bacterium]|nr:DUF503 domain-containing protein [Pseudomonadota bacterium]
MNVASLTVKFHLAGCCSLKEKRQCLGGLKEKYGRAPNVAVCESGYQDAHQHAQWTFVACSSDAKVVEQTLSDVERSIVTTVDAQIVSVDRCWLN